MNEIIWSYINKTVDNHQVLEDWHTIAENLEHILHIDQFDQIHTTVQDYIALHDLSDIDVQYDGEPKRRTIKDIEEVRRAV